MIMTDESCRKAAAGKFVCERVREHFVRSAASSVLICKCANLPCSSVDGGWEILESEACSVLKCSLKVSPSEMQSEVQSSVEWPASLQIYHRSVRRLAGGEWH